MKMIVGRHRFGVAEVCVTWAVRKDAGLTLWSPNRRGPTSPDDDMTRDNAQ